VISICIPIYNFDVTALVHDLHAQGEAAGTPFQIILMDDASRDEFRIKNRELASLKNVEHIQLRSNLGRTGIRNLLAETAVYRYLLFIDCDSQVVSNDYLELYFPFCRPGIICSGGRAYLDAPEDERLNLHWRVGVTKEITSAEQRSIQPNKSFMSCNFLIDKKIFQTVRFDERLKGYCNEDTLFGIELERNGIVIHHIDNPLCHIGLESSVEFLAKIENGIRNLHKIDRMLEGDPLFVKSVTIMRHYHRLKKLKLPPLISLAYRIAEKPIRANLFGKNPSIKLYDLYKLGYLCYTRNWEDD
jgi:glycosyltransferase involved in cell wall biosynthesis